MTIELATLKGSFPITYYGGKDDGSTDTKQPLRDAVDDAVSKGGGKITFPRTALGGIYEFSGGLVNGQLGSNITFEGEGYPILRKSFAGDFFPTGGSQGKWFNLYFDQQGQLYTGALLRLAANEGSQEMAGCFVVNGGSSIILIDSVGGSGCNIHNNWFTCHSSIAGAAAVKTSFSAFEVSACPRKFHHNFCYGPNTKFADVNGCHGFYCDNIYSNGIQFGDNLANGLITNCRMAITSASGGAITISGVGVEVHHNIIGGTGSLTLANGFRYGKFVDNEMDPAMTWVDNTIKNGAADQPFVEDPRYAAGKQVPIMTTANLPAASALMNGRMFIEDIDGAGNFALVAYCRGQRRRFSGVVF